MNFSIYLDEQLSAQLKKKVVHSKKTRNALITEAIRYWLDACRTTTWPAVLLSDDMAKEFNRFEKYRAKSTTKRRF